MADVMENEVMEEQVEPMAVAEEPVESPESIEAGRRAMADQIKRMIAENHRMIEQGDDVEGRTRMIGVLENELKKYE